MFSQYKYPDPCSFSFSKQFTTYMRIEPFCLSIENNDKRKQLQMKMKKYKREEERKKLIFKVGTIRKTSYCWPNSNPTLPCTLERKNPVFSKCIFLHKPWYDLLLEKSKTIFKVRLVDLIQRPYKAHFSRRRCKYTCYQLHY